MAKVMIGVAWPYANGTIHLGHLAGSLLPPDIYRRYCLLNGDEPLMVSGSDQHGTPITVTAEKEKTTPLAVAEKFHAINKKAIEDMGIDFSLFTKTHTDNHIAVVQRIFNDLLKKDLLYKKETMQYYCPKCSKFLPDRYVIGVCPKCGKDVKGDQCEDCGTTFETGDLKNAKCMHCGSIPEIKGTEHFFLRLSVFQERLLKYLEETKWSRSNVQTFTENWMSEGLNDRAITRDMDWGVPVPIDGWDDKVIYVWFEAVIGYLSASVEYSKLIGEPDFWKTYWMDPEVKHYYFLGKDNIPFHSIIWPAILMGCGHLNLPNDIPANEFLNFKGGKLSKSKGGAIDIPSILKDYEPDVMRYYLSVNMPDTHDSEFSWEEFQAKVNNELVSALGNFYHRCLSFTKKNFNVMPPSINDGESEKVEEEIERALEEYEGYMNAFDFKKAIRTVMELSRWGNRYFDSVKPWATVKTDKDKCGSDLNANMRIVKALTIMAWPFLPFSSEKIWDMIGQGGTIQECGLDGILKPLKAGIELKEPTPVYKKIESVPQDPTAENAEKKKEPKKEEKMEPQEPDTGKFADFRRLDIRVGEVIEANDHPDAEKLFVLKVNVGEERQVVAGLKAYYSKEEITGRKVLVVYNLKPAKLRGERSEGMLLAADDEDVGGTSVLLLKPSKDVPNGTRMNCGMNSREGRIEYKEFQNAVMKVVAVDGGNIKSDGAQSSIATDLQCVAAIIDGTDIIPLTDGKDCFATVDGKMNGAKIR